MTKKENVKKEKGRVRDGRESRGTSGVRPKLSTYHGAGLTYAGCRLLRSALYVYGHTSWDSAYYRHSRRTTESLKSSFSNPDEATTLFLHFNAFFLLNRQWSRPIDMRQVPNLVESRLFFYSVVVGFYFVIFFPSFACVLNISYSASWFVE